MSTAFIAIGAISLGGIFYRFAVRMSARLAARTALNKEFNS